MSDPYYPPPSDDFTSAPPYIDAPPPPRRRIVPVTAGILGGVLAGILIAWAISSSATAGNGHAAAQQAVASAPSGYPANWPGGYRDNAGPFGRRDTPGSSGTVTAVGADSVTIKSASGTKTYPVTSASDIDKNGEATLADLKPGDKVRFDTRTANGKTIIDHLHAGNEALDRPAGGRGC